MGRVAVPYAVKGWIKIQAFTEYLDSLLDYPTWWLGKQGQWRQFTVLEAKVHSQSLIAHLEGLDDRDAAEAITGSEIAVARDELPPTDENEFYWSDLIGFQVVNLAGETLGRLEGFLETGAHDVMQVKGAKDYQVPFTAPIVDRVEKEAARVVVDWGLDY
ncbi:MAG: ribosome maturation factor RimM [Hydrogenophilales bacterium]|nr:ribosome maturation factor RimM [Hydrogenophilales bacterium]